MEKIALHFQCILKRILHWKDCKWIICRSLYSSMCLYWAVAHVTMQHHREYCYKGDMFGQCHASSAIPPSVPDVTPFNLFFTSCLLKNLSLLDRTQCKKAVILNEVCFELEERFWAVIRHIPSSCGDALSNMWLLHNYSSYVAKNSRTWWINTRVIVSRTDAASGKILACCIIWDEYPNWKMESRVSRSKLAENGMLVQVLPSKMATISK